MTRSESASYCLRPLEKTDLPALTEWFSDLDDLCAFDRAARVPLNREATEKVWSQSLEGEGNDGSSWFAIDDDSREFVGAVGLEKISAINRDAVVPLYMAKSARRQGIGIRAVALMLDFAFDQLGLLRVTSYYRADNEASRSITERLGFRVEGRMRQAWFCKGRHFDMVVVGVLVDEWRERRVALAAELRPEIGVAFGRNPSTSWSWPPRDANAGA